MNYHQALKYLIVLAIFAVCYGKMHAQEMEKKDAIIIIKDNGNLTFPEWTEEGTEIFYQSDQNGNWDIYSYNFKNKTVKQITFSKEDEQHPAWWHKHNSVAFDSKKNGISFLYYYDFKKSKVFPLFNRNISCRQPSFDPNGRLVAFSGYDRETEQWQLFTYDFVYDNLNRLSIEKRQVMFPVFSPKGNKLLYQPIVNKEDTVADIKMVNWYGKPLVDFNKKALLKVNFSPDDWRIFYIKVTGKGCQLKSMRKDGTSIVDITEIYPEICCPAVSPDNTKLAVSIKANGKFKIYVFDISEY